jgi:nucleoid-associated protein YgaU
MTKSPLKITQCTVAKNGTVTLGSKSFEALLNPSEFKHDHSISYDETKTLGQPAADPKFGAVNPDTLDFSILLDGTGVVNGPGNRPIEVADSMQALSGVVYAYVGTAHQPSPVRVLWGTTIFYGRLKSMSTQYTLFKPSGQPLRAKVTMGFVGFMSKTEGKLTANMSSPDRSHRVLVKEGDTLPLLCNKIYGDPWYHEEVARFNHLSNVRRLVPGTMLHFPPLE